MLEAELWSAAASLLGQAVARRVRVRSLRLKLAGLARRPRQPGLFEDRPRIRDAALTTALDRIRKRHGGGAIRVGAAA
jgi:hypothetical protein